jgi:hypothetical protein
VLLIVIKCGISELERKEEKLCSVKQAQNNKTFIAMKTVILDCVEDCFKAFHTK